MFGTIDHLRVALLAGGFVAFAVGWGWNGLFNLAVVKAHGRAPARATGIVQTGGRLGSMFGPLLFALLLTHWSYWVGWLAAAAEACVAAAVLTVGAALVRRGKVRSLADVPEVVEYGG